MEVDESNSLDNLLEQRIISEIKVEPSISQTRLAEITGTSVRTIKREIKKLVDSPGTLNELKSNATVNGLY